MLDVINKLKYTLAKYKNMSKIKRFFVNCLLAMLTLFVVVFLAVFISAVSSVTKAPNESTTTTTELPGEQSTYGGDDVYTPDTSVLAATTIIDVTETTAREQTTTEPPNEANTSCLDINTVPIFSDKPYIVINDNLPAFSDDEKVPCSFERYSDLDRYGRCGVAYACIGRDLMPDGERGSIGAIKPSGWHTVKYSGIDGNYLYNRCHLIGWQLAGENANEKNLITGTRYLNIEGMLPFENMVADYIKETGNHVLYRVTPVYEGNNLLANGVHMEAYSIEDAGDGICFNVFCYNAQPGITIDYTDGSSSGPPMEQTTHHQTATTKTSSAQNGENINSGIDYVINTNTGKFHNPSCASVKDIKTHNREDFVGSRQEVIDRGFVPCGRCHP